MKRIFTIVAVLACSAAFSQDIKTELPTIVPPSPSVAALMKFEEVQVDNYTGIPNISIPLFTCNTRSAGLNLDISLKYHPSSVNEKEFSSTVGLGWVLAAGGTVSRTVRGIPDEYFKAGNINNKVGIYHDNLNAANHNSYYHVMDNLQNSLPVTSQSIEMTSEFLWEANEKGKYDTEQDLWQFQFFNYSGRFIIEKNRISGLLEIVMLSNDSPLKIVNHYDQTSYLPTSFDVYDDKGYKYTFDTVEVTTTHNSTYSEFFGPGLNSNNSIGLETEYPSSFHLSRVFDTNGNLLLSFEYELSRESVVDYSITYSEVLYTDLGDLYNNLGSANCEAQIQKLDPFYRKVAQFRDTAVRTLKQILVDGKAIVDFSFQGGRQDSNYRSVDNASIFTGIVVKDWQSNNRKQITLSHSYFGGNNVRLRLDRVSFKNFENLKTEDYQIYYRIGNPDQTDIKTDPWGYATFVNPFGQPCRKMTTGNLIQKMILPSGGSVIYDFEQNTYSYIGGTLVSNFDANSDNWSPVAETVYFNTLAANSVSLFNIAESTRVDFETNVDMGTNQVGDWKFTISRVVNGVIDTNVIKTIELNPVFYSGAEPDPCGDGVCSVSFDLPAGEYVARFSTTGNVQTQFDAALMVSYLERKEEVLPFLYGGGNRIRSISYFTDDVSQNVYEIDYSGPEVTPAKKREYRYDFFDQPGKTSGSLAFLEPVFKYQITKRPCIECSNGYGDSNEFTYNVTTSFDNVPVVKTKGADVGYKNVMVYEQDNGYTKYFYRSPIDFPETMQSISLPFIPDANYDYRRGLPFREELYHKNGTLLSETTFQYDLDEGIRATGIKTFYQGITSCPMSMYYDEYSEYKEFISHCSQNPDFVNCNSQPRTNPNNCMCFCYCGRPFDFIGYDIVEEAYGWVKLSGKTTKNYFYEVSNQQIVQTNETFTYNTLNKQMATHSVSTSTGGTINTEYLYHTGDSDVSQNRISEIEQINTSDATGPLTSTRVIYTNAHGVHHPWLRDRVQASKGMGSFEDRILYNQYDEFGNVLEVQQPGGAKTAYIWGYNDTQPVAKIENTAYSAIPSGVLASIKTDSAANNLQQLESDFALLRSQAPLAASMVTTMAYTPLVGVVLSIDPKGIKTTYDYDEFGRLKAVYDQEGNILSENEYHYRTQTP
jgi:YD repeat-containing protein